MSSLTPQPGPTAQGTAMQKLRIGRLGLGTGRQKRVLDDGHYPKLSRCTCTCEYGERWLEGNRRASRNGRVSDLPPEIPNVTIRTFCIAVRRARGCCRV
jgi:hypothetical protein